MASIKHSLAWAGYKFTSTILDDVWPQALFFTGIATMVTVVSKFTSISLSLPPTMLTVLSAVVSLVVSFKTNNSYIRWWEGRNIWSNLTSNSRQLAMIIWLQIPNVPKPKDDDKDMKDDKKTASSSDHSIDGGDAQRKATASAGFAPSSDGTRPERQWHKKGEHAKQEEVEPLLAFKSEEEGSSSSPSSEEETKQGEEAKRAKEERELLTGLIEKKTYIGLIQAFSVAMKHSLRGEKGPFYSDLYSLIAFLPKYNPSAFPPITRDHLLVLWQNGIPRQKWHKADDVCAVPLTHPAAYDGLAFQLLDGATPPVSGPSDKEANPTGLTTTSSKFKEQAVTSAAKFVNASDPDVVGFATLDRNDHSLRRRGDSEEKDAVTITTVELMPPRHPPSPRFWDFFPPLRLFKVIYDWFKTKKRLEVQERAKGGKRRRSVKAVKSEIPQEILMYLSAYIADTAKRGDMNTSFFSPLMTAVMELQKSMTDLDKIATTPIPSAYAFHLRLTVWAYLFFLPFQLYQSIQWLTIPATAIAAITYLGFLEIGAQIEMPFGYEQSDLDLDKFVLKITQQLAEITAFPTVVPTRNIVLSSLNQPFLPSLTLTAPELLGENEPIITPTTMGFAASYPEVKRGEGALDGEASTTSRPLPKTVRDIEIALNANWREIVNENKQLMGHQRDQLENRTGMEVGVLAL